MSKEPGISKHPLERAGTALIILTLVTAYLVGGTWGITALWNAGLPWLGFILGVVVMVIFGAALAGVGTSIREGQLVRKDWN